MGRVRVSNVPVADRLAAVTEVLRRESDDRAAGWAYAAGYLESALEKALAQLPLGKREAFLANLEKSVKPKTKKVRNLMTGVEIEIPYDTPLACDPSSETYWSM